MHKCYDWPDIKINMIDEISGLTGPDKLVATVELMLSESSDGWQTLIFATGLSYGYEALLKALDRVMIRDDFAIARIAKAYATDFRFQDVTYGVMKESGYLQSAGPLSDTWDVVAFAGTSKRLNGPVQISLFRQESVLCLQMPGQNYMETDLEAYIAYAQWIGEILKELK